MLPTERFLTQRMCFWLRWTRQELQRSSVVRNALVLLTSGAACVRGQVWWVTISKSSHFSLRFVKICTNKMPHVEFWSYGISNRLMATRWSPWAPSISCAATFVSTSSSLPISWPWTAVWTAAGTATAQTVRVPLYSWRAILSSSAARSASESTKR